MPIWRSVSSYNNFVLISRNTEIKIYTYMTLIGPVVTYGGENMDINKKEKRNTKEGSKKYCKTYLWPS